MSLATAKTQSLTTISGGINRLKTKGGAARDALFDLVNGYVTAANTVVPRPGTDRNANLAALAPVGATKGLVGFQGQLHVFSASVVPVPAGYQLHVLNHPAVQQPGNNTTFSMTANHNFLAPTNIGYSVGSYGSVTPTTLLGADGRTYTVEAMINYGTINNDFLLQLTYSGADPAQTDAFAQVSFTDQNGHLHTFSSSVVGSFSAGGGTASWEWAQPNGAMFANAGVYPITIGQAANISIPIKEIHFASPFMGVLFVTAEFSVADPTVLAQYGSVFHYWIQSGSTWVASEDRMIGDIVVPSVPNGLEYVASRHGTPNPVWAPSVLHSVNDKVEPTVPNGFYFTAITTEGANPVSGATEPTWPTTDSATVTENSAIDSDQVASLVTAAPQPATNVPNSTITTRYGNPAGGFSL
jgi:hypothetical protein